MANYEKDESIKKIQIPQEPFEVYYFNCEIPGLVYGTIVDIETRGLDPLDKISAIGFVKWNKLSAFVITAEHEELYQHEFRLWMDRKLNRCPRPFIAYNKGFEESFLGIEFDRDIQPINYQAKDRDIDNYYGFKPRAIEIDHLGDIIGNDKMVDAGERDILHHLIQDLYTELALYITRAHEVRWGKAIFPSKVEIQ